MIKIKRVERCTVNKFRDDPIGEYHDSVAAYTDLKNHKIYCASECDAEIKTVEVPEDYTLQGERR